jgi:hypothetical protein
MECGRGRGAPGECRPLGRRGSAKRTHSGAGAFPRFRFLGFCGAQDLLEDAKKCDMPGWYFRILLQNILAGCDGDLGEATPLSITPTSYRWCPCHSWLGEKCSEGVAGGDPKIGCHDYLYDRPPPGAPRGVSSAGEMRPSQTNKWNAGMLTIQISGVIWRASSNWKMPRRATCQGWYFRILLHVNFLLGPSFCPA